MPVASISGAPRRDTSGSLELITHYASEGLEIIDQLRKHFLTDGGNSPPLCSPILLGSILLNENKIKNKKESTLLSQTLKEMCKTNISFISNAQEMTSTYL